jgi:peptidoglycan/LPS O-acetylase OafA/YrhL
MMNGLSNRIPSLDGLRAISILMVIACHLSMSISTSDQKAGKLLSYFEALGPLGVRVFFVISGFLITSLLITEMRTGRIHLGKFYLRRTLRIFPPYYCLIAAIALLSSMGFVQLQGGDVRAALTYTSNYHEGSWYLGHTWSLSVEEQFYLLWPALLWLLGSRKGLFAAGMMLALCPLLRILLLTNVPSAAGGIGYRFETVADSVAAGCILAGTRGWLNMNKYYQKLQSSRIMILLPFSILLISLLAITRFSLWVQFVGLTLVNVGVALCIDWSIKNLKTRVGRVLNSKIFIYLGGMSYSIYLWQQLFLGPEKYMPFSNPIIGLMMVMIASAGSYFLIERPALWIRRRIESRLFDGKQRHVCIGQPVSLAE